MVRFSHAVDPSTLRIKVAAHTVDADGHLPDERSPEEPLVRYMTYSFAEDEAEGRGAEGGSATLSLGRDWLELIPFGRLPTGPRLVLIVEAGLADSDGLTNARRQRLPFSYPVRCEKTTTPLRETLPAFVLLNIEAPTRTQIALFASFSPDGPDGRLRASFSRAVRASSASCPIACGSEETCATVPTPRCVRPSERAGTPDEFPDFVPDPDSAAGFSFEAAGCQSSTEEGSFALATAPATMRLKQPALTISGLTMSASITTGARVLSGSASADSVVLGATTNLGPSHGSLSGKTLPSPPQSK